LGALTRRQTLTLGGGAVAAIGIGVAARLLLRKRYAPSPYDDLLALLDDRDAAAQIGETVLAKVRDFEPIALANSLRARIKGRSLAIVTTEDATLGRIVEASGWVLPETLGLICVLAAKAAA
jgi:hypothetical protein